MNDFFSSPAVCNTVTGIPSLGHILYIDETVFHLPVRFSAAVCISHKDNKVPLCSPQRMAL